MKSYVSSFPNAYLTVKIKIVWYIILLVIARLIFTNAIGII